MTGITGTITNPERSEAAAETWHRMVRCVCQGDISHHSGHNEGRVAARPSDEAAA